MRYIKTAQLQQREATEPLPPEFIAKLNNLVSLLATAMSREGGTDSYTFKHRVKQEQDTISALGAMIDQLADRNWYNYKYTKQAWNSLDKSNSQHVIEWYNESLVPAIRQDLKLFRSIKHHDADVLHGKDKIKYKGHQTWDGPSPSVLNAPAAQRPQQFDPDIG